VFFQERPEVIDKKFQERATSDPVRPLTGATRRQHGAPPEIPFVLQANGQGLAAKAA